MIKLQETFTLKLKDFSGNAIIEDFGEDDKNIIIKFNNMH